MALVIEELAKAGSGDRARIEQLVSGQEARIRRAFRTFLDSTRSDDVRRQVRLALERGDIDGAMAIIDTHVAPMGDAVARGFLEAGVSESAALGRQLRRTGIAISFDPSYPRAAELMRKNRLEFVQGFTRAQRETTRAALVDALRSGAGPIQAARAFRDSIGLTETQRQAVLRYRTQLETGDKGALSRDLRDRRFDRSVNRAVGDDDPLGPERIARMVSQYRNRYLQYRAETIARTETLGAINSARAEALTQAVERTQLPDTAVTRVWRATQDERTRDTHAAMDGQEQPYGMPFMSPRGAQLMFPGDTSLGAPPEEVINCRCVLMTSFAAP